ncbi:hypothetical protein ANOM_008082 [Aspergillus nomiae NRRL 13137]|uniref:SMP-30/Gluconolactonase/LRE-like region domain-containing protein n=1 Tax=Aspergillus nomiae NRRL (strain ATCC 15546 / NRRL 13137 / CBS 260.88 / M93) TaxID=1509407 RepID=A0A0L1J194_ASPN3|nr:uncharacterized protein ANOM_008082 [Aspergillus nomiae NRRL 13137]KNG85208.1 hypothetical protein ANOM_008082 [Aspergillus nomiae NRRL 13137]
MTGPKQLSHTTLTDGFFFGEAPRYKDGLLYISDMTGRTIHSIDTQSGENKALCTVENQPNGMCFTPDGALIWSSMFDAKLYRHDFSTGKDTLYADMSRVMTGYCGDMTVDSTGRVYVGDTGARVLHGEQPRAGRLLVVETDGSVDVAAEDIMFPNALFISNDGETIYCAETFGYGLLRWDIGAAGRMANRQKVWSPAVLSPSGQTGNTESHGIVGIDGGCMDAEGGMWLSLLGLEKFVRVDQQGNVTHEIKVDGHATACTLGGPDGNTLYLVVNWVPEHENLFTAMVAKRTKCTVGYTRVDVGKGTASP